MMVSDNHHNSSSHHSPSQRKGDKPSSSSSSSSWSLTTCLLYGGAGIAAGVIGYYAHKWIKETFETQSDESTKQAYDQYEAKHHRSTEALKRLTTNNDSTKRREAIINLVRNIEFHFYRNQQISDVTALRSLSNIQLYINSTFNVTPLTDLLRDNPSSLTPAEKHHSFNKVKVLCFCRVLTALYVFLFRLWVHRIEINILGRQWLPQLITSANGEKVSDDDLKTLQRELEACESSLNSSTLDASSLVASQQSQPSNGTASSIDAVEISSTEFHSSMSESELSSSATPLLNNHSTDFTTMNKISFFNRSRQSQYSSRQHATLYPPIDLSTTVNSEANYVFLTSTRWLEYQAGLSSCSHLIKPIVEDSLCDTYPQHFINLSALQNLFNQMCERFEMQIFGPSNIGISDTDLSNVGSSSQPVTTQQAQSSSTSSLIVDLLLPESITPFDTPSQKTPDTQRDVQRMDQPQGTQQQQQPSHNDNHEMDDKNRSNANHFHFDASSLKSDEDKHFVQGCLAETRDILESSAFKLSFISSRRSLLAKVIELLSEKLPPPAQSGESFPLCRLFGRLCGVAELLLIETSEEGNSTHSIDDPRQSDVMLDNNEFASLFSGLASVEHFCGAIYLPSIMCPDLLVAATNTVECTSLSSMPVSVTNNISSSQ